MASVYLLILPSMKRNDVENSDLWDSFLIIH